MLVQTTDQGAVDDDAGDSAPRELVERMTSVPDPARVDYSGYHEVG